MSSRHSKRPHHYEEDKHVLEREDYLQHVAFEAAHDTNLLAPTHEGAQTRLAHNPN